MSWCPGRPAQVSSRRTLTRTITITRTGREEVWTRAAAAAAAVVAAGGGGGGGGERAIDYVTIVTQVTVDRIGKRRKHSRLHDMAREWQGALSIAVYIKSADEIEFVEKVRRVKSEG